MLMIMMMVLLQYNVHCFDFVIGRFMVKISGALITLALKSPSRQPFKPYTIYRLHTRLMIRI